MGRECGAEFEREDASSQARRDNQLVSVSCTPEQAMTFVLKECFRRSASHSLRYLDAVVVCLLGLDDIVILTGCGHLGTCVPPRQQAVGRLGQCKARNIVVDIVEWCVVVRGSQGTLFGP